MIIVTSFDGIPLSDLNSQGVVLSNAPTGADPVFITLMGGDPLYAGTFAGRVSSVPVSVRVNDLTNLDQVRALFRRGRSGALGVTFADGSAWTRFCVVVEFIPQQEVGVFTAMLQAAESTWKKAVETIEATWEVDTSGDTRVITVGGSVETCLSVRLTPVINPTIGYAYQRLYELVNTPGVNFGVRWWGISLDTAALVIAGKMQADCDDLRVIVDGVETPRWIVDSNTDHTKVFFNISMAAGYALSLKTAVAASGAVSYLYFNKVANNLAALKALPASGVVKHGTEWFAYSAKDVANYRLRVSQRGLFGTTQQAHLVNDVFSWVQHSIWLVYGNSAVSAPSATDELYDNTKPAFDLATSDNDTAAYTASSAFYDTNSTGRTGSWASSIKRTGNVSDLYNVKGDAESGDGALGMKMGTWVGGGVQKAETATLAWTFYYAGGISTASMTGRKYRSTARWPALAALQRSNDGKTWYTIWSEGSPAVEDTWENWEHNNASVGNMRYIRLILSGSMAALADAAAYFECLTAVVELRTTYTPSAALLSESGSYTMDTTLTNLTSGDAVVIQCPMEIGKVFCLDGEEHTASYDSNNMHGTVALNDESRADWIRLAPGVNVIEVTGPDVGVVDIDLSWFERRA